MLILLDHPEISCSVSFASKITFITLTLRALMPPASQTYFADSPGHIKTGWLASSSAFILASAEGVGYVPQVIEPD